MSVTEALFDEKGEGVKQPEKYTAIQAARLERRRKQAAARQRADFWLAKKKEQDKNGVYAFGKTLSYITLRDKGYRALAEGDTETATLINELLKLRRRTEKSGPLLKAVRRVQRAQAFLDLATVNACSQRLSPSAKGKLTIERKKKRAEREAKQPS